MGGVHHLLFMTPTKKTREAQPFLRRQPHFFENAILLCIGNIDPFKSSGRI